MGEQAFLQINEDHLATIIASYDAQGDHRAGTAVDNELAQWLVRQINEAGAKPELQAFPLRRIDLKACYLQLDGRRIDAVPVFDHDFTDPAGIEGSFGPLGGNDDICLAADGQSNHGGTEPRELMVQAQASGHKAAVIVSSGARPGLSLLNAPTFHNPAGIPVLQVSSTEGRWLHERARAGMRATFVAHVTRTDTQAFNVIAAISGTESKLSPLIFTTPRSGWWHCASERGGGLGCWLTMISALAAARPARDCHFASFSGHELGLLGGESYVAAQRQLLGRLHRWIHFGANLGAPGQPLLVQSSDDALRSWTESILAQHNVAIETPAAPGRRPRGEASFPHRFGIPYIAPISESHVFHHPSDRWPEAVDITAVAKLARVFSRIAIESAMN